jgi:Arc/MetJ-type ribon-helix-helix transcriptional regulator
MKHKLTKPFSVSITEEQLAWLDENRGPGGSRCDALRRVLEQAQHVWQKIETYPKPTKEWDYSAQPTLLYSRSTGIVIGICILENAETKEHFYQYDCEGLDIEPSHWMPLPAEPSE